MIPFEFRNDLWCQKTRVKALSCGVICVILRLAVLIQYRSVTDTHTHRQTDRHTTTAYTALSKASRGKNVAKVSEVMTYGCLLIVSTPDIQTDIGQIVIVMLIMSRSYRP